MQKTNAVGRSCDCFYKHCHKSVAKLIMQTLSAQPLNLFILTAYFSLCSLFKQPKNKISYTIKPLSLTYQDFQINHIT